MVQLLRLWQGLGAGLALLIGGGLAAPVLAQTPKGQGAGADLTIATWGGFYQRAQTQVLAEPFGFQSGKSVAVVTFTGQPDEVRQRVDAYRSSGQPLGWDVLDLERSDAEQLCFEGVLRPLDLVRMGLGDAENDFVHGGIGLCWVGNVVWSQSFAFDRRLYSGAEPFALADAFDTLLFPGRRVLTHSAQGLMELALLSDGVSPERIYEVLGTPAGVTQAVAVLNLIRNDTHFVDTPADAFNELQTGRAAMAMIHHFEALRAARAGQPFIGFIWDNHVVDMDVFAVPSGAGNPTLAMEFIANVSRAAYQSAMATVTGYGPARLSAAQAAREDLRAWLPTAPAAIPRALLFDATFWTSPEGISAQAAYDGWRLSIE